LHGGEYSSVFAQPAVDIPHKVIGYGILPIVERIPATIGTKLLIATPPQRSAAI
jgi:hypothetical protein